MAGMEKEIYRNELAKRQMEVKDEGIPVVIILEGWGTSGKGSALGSIIKYMDPRFFKTYNMDVKTQEEARRPFLYRYFTKLPAKGQFVFLDGGYVEELTRLRMTGEIGDKKFNEYEQSIRQYERQLRDNGYLVIKFFLNIDKETQKQRIEGLKGDKNTRWRVSKSDEHQNKHYKEYEHCYKKLIEATDTLACPWHVVNANDKKDVERFIAETIISSIDRERNERWKGELVDNQYPLQEMPKLSEISLSDKVITDEEYKKKLKTLQKELAKLHNILYRKKIPVIIAYEGWDAAGKGGNIKRISAALDSRGYEVFPIASPTGEEKNRHYLWRFYNRLPKTGHIAIFDRTWYGRVMVERLEGFCTENDWKRAYNEINEFENDLSKWGAVVIKFWIQIDKDTQLARFTDRQNTPEKQWKITDEDWRNREKWDQYESAVDEMIQKTSTKNCPWHIIESNDKKYARIKALEIVISEIKKALK